MRSQTTPARGQPRQKTFLIPLFSLGNPLRAVLPQSSSRSVRLLRGIGAYITCSARRFNRPPKAGRRAHSDVSFLLCRTCPNLAPVSKKRRNLLFYRMSKKSGTPVEKPIGRPLYYQARRDFHLSQQGIGLPRNNFGGGSSPATSRAFASTCSPTAWEHRKRGDTT